MADNVFMADYFKYRVKNIAPYNFLAKKIQEALKDYIQETPTLNVLIDMSAKDGTTYLLVSENFGTKNEIKPKNIYDVEYAITECLYENNFEVTDTQERTFDYKIEFR
jgi:hypothetical protein